MESYSIHRRAGNVQNDSLSNLVSTYEESKVLALQDLKLLAVINRDGSSKTFLIEYEVDKQVYAMKVFKKSVILENNEVTNRKIQIRFLQHALKSRHPFIVRLHDIMLTDMRVHFIMEFVSGGDLMWHIQQGQFSYDQSRFYAAEICLALEYLHDEGYLYRDMTLDKILLGSDGHIKVTGLDYLKDGMTSTSRTSTFCGSHEFMAPEMLLEKSYGFPVDWWAFGIMLYEMLLRQAPFRGEDEDEIYNAILCEDPVFPLELANQAIEMIRKLLERDPKRRLGSNRDAKEVKSSEFFDNIDWKALYEKRLEPPLKPNVKSDRDTDNFDKEWTSKTPQMTPLIGALTDEEQRQFEDFSLDDGYKANPI